MPVIWKKRALRDSIFLAALTICAFGLLYHSRAVSAAVAQALDLCLSVLLPSLYPFFVLSALLISSGMVQRMAPLLERPMRAIFDLPGSCAAAVILGAVGGYPVGARTAASLYQQKLCTLEDAKKLLRFCNNAGPAFFISAVGAGLLQDARLGVFLYGIHLLTALALSLSPVKKQHTVKHINFTPISPKKQSFLTAFLQAVSGSFATFINVCAYVLFFAVLMCLLQQTPLFLQLCAALPGSTVFWQGICSGLLEVTAGTSALASAGLSHKILLPALSFLCGWGGLSVQFQSISLLKEGGLPCRGYLKCKLLHGLLAAVLTILFCL